MGDGKKTVGEMIAAGEIGPDSPATRGEMAKLWSYADRHAAQIEDLQHVLEGALERIKTLERQRELDEEYAREQAERNW